MAVTNVSDIIIPEEFLGYVIHRTNELSEFVQSGVINLDPQFSQIAGEGGVTAHLPFFNDLSGEEETINRTDDVTIGNITTGQDVCVKFLRQKAFGARDIAGLLAGSDPISAIGDLFAGWWKRQDQRRLFYSLNGIFGSSSMADLVKDISHSSGGPTTANYFTGRTFIDAKQLLGDAKEKLTAIAMHSATEAWLAKQDLIDIIPDSQGTGRVKTFQGLRCIIDDGMPTATVDGDTAYTTYLFAEGAIAMGDSNIDYAPLGAMGTWRLEYYRNAKGGESSIIMRRKLIQHMRGVKWTGAVMAGDTPINSELSNASNWSRVWEKKDMRIVKFVHNVGQ